MRKLLLNYSIDKSSHQQGSILVFVLVMMGVVMILALGMMQSTTVNQQSARVTDDAAVAFQAADSGAELAYMQVMKNLVETVGDVGTCNNGTITGSIVAGGNYMIDFYDDVPNRVGSCGDTLVDVRSARVRGFFGRSIRAIQIQLPVPQDVGDGLIAQWKFDDGAGNTADDAVGNSNLNTGYLSGASWNTSNNVIGAAAVQLDGSNDYIRVDDDEDFDFTSSNDYTFSLWVRPDNTSSEDAVFTKTFNDSGARYGLLRDGGNWKFTMNSNSISDNSAQASTWTHVVVYKDSGDVKLYINAIEKDSMPAVDTKGADDDFLIGEATSSASINNFDGLIDDMRVYDRALTDDEILILCRGGRGEVACGL